MASAMELLVQQAAAGKSAWKFACRVVATSNISLQGLQTIDGVTVAAGDRVLVAGQTAAAQNGIWVAATGAWARAADMLLDSHASLGLSVNVLAGLRFSQTQWVMSAPTTGSVQLGATSITFTQAMAASATTLTLPLVVESDAVSTDAGSGVLAIALAQSGHVEGKTRTHVIPHGVRSGLILANDLNASGDATIDANGVVTDFDPASDYLIAVSRFGGRCVSVIRNLGTLDVVAPSVQGNPTVTLAAPSSLVVVFSEPVYLPSLAGLSLSFSVGTARTITALASGNGTNTLTFTLSGAMSGTDVATFTIGSLRTLQDMNGNLAATSTTSITLSGFGLAQYGFTHEWRADAGVIGSPVSGLNDQIGTFHLSQASGSLQPAFVAGPPAYLNCDGVNDKVSSQSGSGTNPADVTDHCVVAHFDCSSPNAGVNTVIGFGNQANYGGIEIGYYGSGGQAIVRWTNDAGTPYQILQTVSAGRLTVIGKLTGGNIYLSVNGGAFSAGTAVSGSVGSTQTYVSIGECNNKANTAKIKFYHAGLGPSAGIDNTAAAAIHSLLTSLHT